MKVISEPSANQHLPEPYEIGEKVIYMGEVERTDPNTPETFYKQFIRVKRLKTKSLMTASRKHFEVIGKKNARKQK